jgi:hypothetical protein
MHSSWAIPNGVQCEFSTTSAFIDHSFQLTVYG